ncbi:MAG TPA: type II secretion system protein GspM [Allosphingosinicella sp.]|jgi:general secretion pathway protein M
MNERFLAWWRVRTVREQRLLAVMAALLALVLGWLLVVRPLGDALDAARTRHAAAVTALAQARAEADAVQRGRGAPAARAPRPVDAFLGRTAAEAGFTGARIAAEGAGRASLALDAARAQAFFSWVRQMEGSGLVVESLRARTNADRTLAVEATFRARSG